jgi:flagellar hook-basal body complex protein FliE
MMEFSLASIEGIGAAPAVSGPDVANVSRVGSDFSQWMSNEVNVLNQQLLTAERGVQQLAAGSAASLHDVMIQLEQSRLAFQLAIQVRNKVVEAYQDVMRMQV